MRRAFHAAAVTTTLVVVSALLAVSARGAMAPPVAENLTSVLRTGLWARERGGDHEWTFTGRDMSVEGWHLAVNVSTARSDMAGWHREEYDVNRTMAESADDATAARAWFAAGYADGFATAQRIWDTFFVNLRSTYDALFGSATARTRAQRWVATILSDQYDYARAFGNSNSTTNASAALRRHVRGHMELIRGRAAGYNRRVKDGRDGSRPQLQHSPEQLDEFAFFFMAVAGADVDLLLDVADAVTAPGSSVANLSTYGPWYPQSGPFAAAPSVLSRAEAIRRQPKTRGFCAARYKPGGEGDLIVGRTVDGNYTDMDNSATVFNVGKVQLAVTRRQQSLVSTESAIFTSNKLWICGTAFVAYDPRFLATGLSQATRALPTVFAASYAAASATTAPDAAAALREAGAAAAHPTSWLIVDTKRSTMGARVAHVVDAFPGNVSFTEDATRRLGEHEGIVIGAVGATTAAAQNFPTPCRYCAVVAATLPPVHAQWHKLMATDEANRTVAAALAVARYNAWQSDASSVIGGHRCAGLALAPRSDLNPASLGGNNSWALSACRRLPRGQTSAVFMSAKLWLDGIASGAAVESYPMMAAMGPTWDSVDTPVYQPSPVAITQVAMYNFPPLNVTNAIAPAWRFKPAATSDNGNHANDNGGKKHFSLVEEHKAPVVFMLVTMGLATFVFIVLYVTRRDPDFNQYHEPLMYDTAGNRVDTRYDASYGYGSTDAAAK